MSRYYRARYFVPTFDIEGFFMEAKSTLSSSRIRRFERTFKFPDYCCFVPHFYLHYIRQSRFSQSLFYHRPLEKVASAHFELTSPPLPPRDGWYQSASGYDKYELVDYFYELYTDSATFEFRLSSPFVYVGSFVRSIDSGPEFVEEEIYNYNPPPLSEFQFIKRFETIIECSTLHHIVYKA